MCKTDSIRYGTIAALGLLTILWGQAGAAPDAPDVVEVKVLDAQVQQGEGELFNVSYRMEVLSVIHAVSSVQPGETVAVRSYGQSQQALERGWMGTAYLKPDLKTASPDGKAPIRACRTRREHGGPSPSTPVIDLHAGSTERRSVSCQSVGGVVDPTPRGRAGSSIPGPYRDGPSVTVDAFEQTGLAMPLIARVKALIRANPRTPKDRSDAQADAG